MDGWMDERVRGPTGRTARAACRAARLFIPSTVVFSDDGISRARTDAVAGWRGTSGGRDARGVRTL